MGSKTFLEVGNGKVLSGMNKRISKNISTQNLLDMKSIEQFINLTRIYYEKSFDYWSNRRDWFEICKFLGNDHEIYILGRMKKS